MARANVPIFDAAITAAQQGTGAQTSPDNWWEFCPICNSKLVNHKCRFVCSNPQCHFFMSCSEFDT